MGKKLIAISSLSLLLLTACSTPNASTWVTPLPADIDKSVAALLPVGSFEVSGEYRTSTGSKITLEGYVNYGSLTDGKVCEADYTLTNVTKNTEETPNIASLVHVIHPKNGPAWYRNESIPTQPGRWYDSSSPYAPILTMLFAPSIVASDFSPGILEGAGTGELCSIPVMPRFMNIEGDNLIFDKVKTKAAVLAARARWAEKFIDATGLTGKDRDKYIKLLLEVSESDYSTLTKEMSITISKNEKDQIEIKQTSDDSEGFMVVIRLTPTETRAVEQVNEITYFDDVSKEVKESGLSSLEFMEKDLNS
jgi:hypothetical protein